MKKLFENVIKNDAMNDVKFENLHDIRTAVLKFIDNTYRQGLITEKFFLKAIKIAFELSDNQAKELFDEKKKEIDNAFKIIKNSKNSKGACKMLAIIGMAFLKKHGVSSQLINRRNEDSKLKVDDWYLKTEFGDFSPYYDIIAFGNVGKIPDND